MDFRFTDQEQAFRQEVSDFLDAELPVELQGTDDTELLVNDDEAWDKTNLFLKKLAKRGWLCPHWPQEYSGAGMNVMQQVIFKEEMTYRGAPSGIGAGVNQIGSTLLVHGTEEQKRRHLPG